MGELLDQQHTDARGGKSFQHGHKPGHDHRREPERKLVGKDVARPADDGLRQHQRVLRLAELPGVDAQQFIRADAELPTQGEALPALGIGPGRVEVLVEVLGETTGLKVFSEDRNDPRSCSAIPKRRTPGRWRRVVEN